MEKKHTIFSNKPAQWKIEAAPVSYPRALDFMEKRVAAIANVDAHELVWLLEHKSLYTAGTSAKPDDLIDPERFPVFKAGRGGQYTYHGPGQRVAYFMLDLKTRGRDVRAFVAGLENLVIDTLADFGVDADRRTGRIGVWVNMPDKTEAKIAAIGVRIRRWVSFHGISINVNPDLEHFSGIVPCGISQHGVTSLHALGIQTHMNAIDEALAKNFEKRFGPINSQ
ncbi:MAG: lipoyl(octanoyl) transferase LipB [Robiginitomaculum sp.]